jgi:hypothetical protein
MSSAKLAVACALAALALSACGTSSKPVAGSVTATASDPAGRGVVDDPRTKHLKCLLAHHLPAVDVGRTSSDGLPGIQIGAPNVGPKVRFAPTPGSAQEAQITNQVESAEVIGSALLYPNRASDQELQIVEDCLAQGVTG